MCVCVCVCTSGVRRRLEREEKEWCSGMSGARWRAAATAVTAPMQDDDDEKFCFNGLNFNSHLLDGGGKGRVMLHTFSVLKINI